jgi:phosphoribosyl-ATP pyrophosphohydrolase/phosphoribosyl-AMP cyclohydrolase
VLEKLNFEKFNGLIPVVVQDTETDQVLMIGFMNREALEITLKDKRITFWSRTKQRLWQKGETSGNYLEFVSAISDCDNDSLLIKAIPHGPVCHTGEFTCFGEEQTIRSKDVIRRLEEIINERHQTMPEGSYTSELFRKGTSHIAQKVGEESVEVIIAALEKDKKRLTEESADLLYHLLVLLRHWNMSLDNVTEELQRRMKK